MKRILFLSIALCLATMGMQAQTSDQSYKSKVGSIDDIITTLYAVISGEKGEERNWELFEYLFYPGAQLSVSQKNSEGNFVLSHRTPQEYKERSGQWLVENGFYEKGLHNTVERFGSIAQVFSTYESFRSKTDTEPFVRGINSIQLFNDGERWWVVNIYWTSETESNPIPKNYLPNN